MQGEVEIERKVGKGVYLTFPIFTGMLFIKNSNATLIYLGVDRPKSRNVKIEYLIGITGSNHENKSRRNIQKLVDRENKSPRNFYNHEKL